MWWLLGGIALFIVLAGWSLVGEGSKLSMAVFRTYAGIIIVVFLYFAAGSCFDMFEPEFSHPHWIHHQ